jgi:hypothetical protein
LIVRLLAVVSVAVLIAPSAVSSAAPSARGLSSTGFVSTRANTKARVTCAVEVLGRADLLCAAAGIKAHAYDGRGIVRLSPAGRVSVARSGNDILLAIDGSVSGKSRPVLRPGATWSRAGYRCSVGAGAVTCFRLKHGFTVSATRLRLF